MSAIHNLKNFALAITGHLFTSSKNEQNNAVAAVKKKISENDQQNSTVRYLTKKKIKHIAASQELSEFTIF